MDNIKLSLYYSSVGYMKVFVNWILDKDGILDKILLKTISGPFPDNNELEAV